MSSLSIRILTAQINTTCPVAVSLRFSYRLPLLSKPIVLNKLALEKLSP